jgi:hypothetical protein
MSLLININLKSVKITINVFSYFNDEKMNSIFDDNLLNSEIVFDFGFSKTTLKPSITNFDLINLLNEVKNNKIEFQDVDKSFKISIYKENLNLNLNLNLNGLKLIYIKDDEFISNIEEVINNIEDVLICFPER